MGVLGLSRTRLGRRVVNLLYKLLRFYGGRSSLLGEEACLTTQPHVLTCAVHELPRIALAAATPPCKAAACGAYATTSNKPPGDGWRSSSEKAATARTAKMHAHDAAR